MDCSIHKQMLTCHQWVCGIPLRAISLKVLMISFCKTSVKITLLRLLPHHPGAMSQSLALLVFSRVMSCFSLVLPPPSLVCPSCCRVLVACLHSCVVVYCQTPPISIQWRPPSALFTHTNWPSCPHNYRSSPPSLGLHSLAMCHNNPHLTSRGCRNEELTDDTIQPHHITHHDWYEYET